MVRINKETKNPVGRPKGVKVNIKFWCDTKDKETIKTFIKSLEPMKKILLLLAFTTLSCTNEYGDCDEAVYKLTEQYYTSVGYANGNKEAIEHLKEAFYKKKNEIYKNCN